VKRQIAAVFLLRRPWNYLYQGRPHQSPLIEIIAVLQTRENLRRQPAIKSRGGGPHAGRPDGGMQSVIAPALKWQFNEKDERR
jgi:hypothetical protein